MTYSRNRVLPLLLGLVWACGGTGKAQSSGAGQTAKATARAAAPDPCTVVTQAEAEAVMGKPLGPPTMKVGGGCWFGDEVGLSFLPVSPPTRQAFEAFLKKEIDDLNASMRKAGAKESVIEPVSDLGEPAFYVDPTLFVYRNKQVLSIFADRPQAVAIATKALTRWK